MKSIFHVIGKYTHTCLLNHSSFAIIFFRTSKTFYIFLLDVENGFDVFGVTTGDGVAQDIDVVYILHDARYAPSLADSAITD